MTEIVRVGDPDTVARTAAVLRAGGVVVLPTDTVYGLAALPGIAGATSRIFDLKGRSATVPMAVLCASAIDALGLAGELSPSARHLAEAHWPGPLTLVLPRRGDLRWDLGEPATTIGVRCPDDPFVRAVTAEVGPIAATSANRHGQPTPSDAEDAAAALTGPVDLVVDGGPLPGSASTVVDATGDPLRVLREGPIAIDDVGDPA